MTTAGRWSATDVRYQTLNSTWAEEGVSGGLELVVPTSVTVVGTGSSATINSTGSVDFSTCTELRLDGIFSNAYDNYRMFFRGTSLDLANTALAYYLRYYGVDTSFTDYVPQYVDAQATSVTGFRGSLGSYPGYLGGVSSTLVSGMVVDFWRPFKMAPTASRSMAQSGASNSGIVDYATISRAINRYDGLNILIGSGYRLSGHIAVYGMRD